MSGTTKPLYLVGRTADEEAADWFARQRSGAMAPDDWANWEAWLAADTAHSRAFNAAQSTWNMLEAIRAEPEMIALREAALKDGSRNLKKWSAIFAGAAVAATVAFISLNPASNLPSESRLYLQTAAKINLPTEMDVSKSEQYQTKIGERRAITLSDGSKVTLDTDSVVGVVMMPAARSVVLKRGRAYFQVAKDSSRPFIVTAGDKKIMAVGTAFDVALGSDKVEVVLSEGKIRVETAASGQSSVTRSTQVEAADLVPGTRLNASNKAGWTLAQTDASSHLSWLSGDLVFDQKPLGEVVAEMNRYSTKKIILRDAALAATPVSGVFGAGQPEVLAEALVSYRLARIDGRSTEEIILTAPVIPH